MSLDGYVAGRGQTVDNPVGIGGIRLHWVGLFRSRTGAPRRGLQTRVGRPGLAAVPNRERSEAPMSRTPSPSRIGTRWITISSSKPARRHCAARLAPKTMTALPAAASLAVATASLRSSERRVTAGW
jgi:hypothetical protein